MMTWDYRVFREESGDYVIREVYYEADGSIFACTQNAVGPSGESLRELVKDLEWFKKALTLPVLTLDDIPRPKSRQRKQSRSQNISSEQVMAELGLTKPNNHRQQSRRVKSPKRVLTAAGKKKR